MKEKMETVLVTGGTGFLGSNLCLRLAREKLGWSPKIMLDEGLAKTIADGTDDVRESPALQIVQELVSWDIKIVAYDPKAMDTARAILGDKIRYAPDAITAAKDVDVLVVLTEWADFKNVSLDKLEMRTKKIIDLRHIIDGQEARQNGFDFQVIGR